MKLLNKIKKGDFDNDLNKLKDIIENSELLELRIESMSRFLLGYANSNTEFLSNVLISEESYELRLIALKILLKKKYKKLEEVILFLLKNELSFFQKIIKKGDFETILKLGQLLQKEKNIIEKIYFTFPVYYSDWILRDKSKYSLRKEDDVRCLEDSRSPFTIFPISPLTKDLKEDLYAENYGIKKKENFLETYSFEDFYAFEKRKVWVGKIPLFSKNYAYQYITGLFVSNKGFIDFHQLDRNLDNICYCNKTKKDSILFYHLKFKTDKEIIICQCKKVGIIIPVFKDSGRMKSGGVNESQKERDINTLYEYAKKKDYDGKSKKKLKNWLIFDLEMDVNTDYRHYLINEVYDKYYSEKKKQEEESKVKIEKEKKKKR